MRVKQSHGLWAQETQSLETIKKKLSAFQGDIAKHTSLISMTIELRQKIEPALSRIDKTVKEYTGISFFDSRLTNVKKELYGTQQEVIVLKKAILLSEIKAQTLTKQYSNTLQKIVYAYNAMNAYEHLEHHHFPLKFSRSLGNRVWFSGQKKLSYFL